MATRDFIRVLVKEYGVKEISSAVAQLRRRLITIQPILQDIGQIYVDEAKYRIETQTDPKGRVWPHNTKSTKKHKSRGLLHVTGKKTFLKKGTLNDTYTRKTYKMVRPPAIEGVNKRLVWTGTLRERLKYRVAGNTVYVVSNVPYATTMQFGASQGEFGEIGNQPIPWGNIPARPFLGTNKKTNERVASKLGEYLLGNRIAKQLGFSQ